MYPPPARTVSVDGVALGTGVGVGVCTGVGDGVGTGVAVGACVGDGVGMGVPVGAGVAVGGGVAVAPPVGVAVGAGVVLAVGAPDGVAVGAGVPLGLLLGAGFVGGRDGVDPPPPPHAASTDIPKAQATVISLPARAIPSLHSSDRRVAPSYAGAVDGQEVQRGSRSGAEQRAGRGTFGPEPPPSRRGS